MKRILSAFVLAATLAACASPAVRRPFDKGTIVLTEKSDDGKPLATYTLDASTISVDPESAAISAPGLPHPLKSYIVVSVKGD